MSSTRWHRHILRLGEMGRFGTVGVIAAGVDVGVSNILFFLTLLGPEAAKAVAVVVATTVAFVGNRTWTFRRRSFARRSREQYLRFWVANLLGLGVNVLVIRIGGSFADLNDIVTYNVVANIVGLGLAASLRYVLYSSWVFTQAAPSQSTEHAARGSAR